MAICVILCDAAERFPTGKDPLKEVWKSDLEGRIQCQVDRHQNEDLSSGFVLSPIIRLAHNESRFLEKYTKV
jgi:hypothetical protein